MYTDPEIFDLEMERIWAKTWIYIGHESQVSEKGSYVTLNYGKVPVVMVRDNDDKVHVLHNRCGHKGAKLVDKPAARSRHFAVAITAGAIASTASCLACRIWRATKAPNSTRTIRNTACRRSVPRVCADSCSRP